MRRRQQGLSLVEIAIFLIIIGYVSTGIMMGVYSALRYSPNTGYATIATELAQGRMDIILGQKAINGFSSFTDICDVVSQPAVCTSLSGYTISSTITTGFGGDNNYKTITVSVSGTGSASVTAIVGNDA